MEQPTQHQCDAGETSSSSSVGHYIFKSCWSTLFFFDTIITPFFSTRNDERLYLSNSQSTHSLNIYNIYMYACIHHHPDCSCLSLKYLPFCLTTSLRKIVGVDNSIQINATYAELVAGFLSPACYLMRWNYIHSIYQTTKCVHCFLFLTHCWENNIFLINLCVKLIFLQCLLFWGLQYIGIGFYGW